MASTVAKMLRYYCYHHHHHGAGWLSDKACILELLGSNLDWDTLCMTVAFSGFPQSLRSNVIVVLGLGRVTR
jgi:hypothetical protein